jgi:hypothetical protein
VPDLQAHTTQRARPFALAGLVGGGLVLVIITAVLVITRLVAPTPSAGAPGAGAPGTGAAGGTATASGSATQTGLQGAIDTFGIATTTSHCPAASAAGAGARCPASPECWNGVFESEGVVTVNSRPCGKPHTWQTFAIAIMPSDASTVDVNIVQANSTVRAVCSYQVLLRSRTGAATKIPRNQWFIQVVPPSEAAYNTGVRTYRCLGRAAGYDGTRGSQFGA